MPTVSVRGKQSHASSLLSLGHAALAAVVGPGDCVFDATAGQGYDTEFLTHLVGPTGRVWAMDIQETAVHISKARLQAAAWPTPSAELGNTPHVQIIQGDHSQFCPALFGETMCHFQAVVFNLGFLPGSNKSVITTAASTVQALDTLWPFLNAGGLLCVHTYSGHTGALQEAEAVAAWLACLPWNLAQVQACTQFNKPKNPETLYLVYKK